MKSRDWLRLGLRLLGVYFLVDGFGRGAWAALTMLQTLPQAGDFGASYLHRIEWSRALAHATANMGAALVLILRTDWCVRLIAGRDAEPPDHAPEPPRSEPFVVKVR